MDHAKPIRILSKICPESILAKSLTDKLTTLAKYEISSIINNAGIINKGTPDGKKILNQFSFWYCIPIIFIPIKKDNA
jgi:hypothetical protein